MERTDSTTEARSGQVHTPLESRAHSLVHVFQERVRESADQPAARIKEQGRWVDVTWAQMEARARRVSQALLAQGVQHGDRVCLMGDTHLDWVVMDLGIQGAGAVTVPIYQSNVPEEVRYVVENCGARWVFTDSPVQTQKLLAVRDRLPEVRHVVQFLGRLNTHDGGWARSVESLFEEGDRFAAENPAAIAERQSMLSADDVSTIIYTSGTTGAPKGVMLTHDAFVFEAESIDSLGLLRATDVELLFLPLAHSFAQVLKAAWIKLGHVMAFAESLEKLIDNMGEVRPTLMAAVPRVFEKAFNKVVSDGSSAPGLRGALFRMTMTEFDRYARERDEGRTYDSWRLTMAKRIVLPKVREKLDERFGGRLRFFVSGSAPLSRKIAYFFDLLGIQILEGYGLTETSAASCVNRPHKNKLGTVGPPIPGVELKIDDDGEVLIRGRGNMKGYFDNPAATAETIDQDGWLHTGDVGSLDNDGYLRITDRKKDIIVTAGGKNVAPQNLENELKASAIISQVVVHGDRRKYLTALVTVAEERARQLAKEQGVEFSDYADLTRKPQVRQAVQAAIDALNATVPSYATIKRFEILPKDFSQESGELTPTLKVKRKEVNRRFAQVFDSMYSEPLH